MQEGGLLLTVVLLVLVAVMIAPCMCLSAISDLNRLITCRGLCHQDKESIVLEQVATLVVGVVSHHAVETSRSSGRLE